MMKNYKALRQFTDEMRIRQGRMNEQKQNYSKEREYGGKTETVSSLQKMFQFFKGIRP